MLIIGTYQQTNLNNLKEEEIIMNISNNLNNPLRNPLNNASYKDLSSENVNILGYTSMLVALINEEILSLMKSACNNPERVRDISKQRKYNPELSRFDIELDVDRNEFVIFLDKKGLPIDLVFKADMYDVEYLDHHIIEVKNVSLETVVIVEGDEEKELEVDNSNEHVKNLINTVNALFLDGVYYGILNDNEVITDDLEEIRSLIYMGDF